MVDDGWSTGGVSGSDEAVLTVVAGAQFSLRISESMKAGGRRDRFEEARSILNQQAVEKLQEVESLQEGGFSDERIRLDTLSLDADNSELLGEVFSDEQRLGFIITALLGNPVQPFQIEVPEKVRQTAVTAFADDLGCPETWVPAITRAVQDAVRSQASLETVVLKVGIGVLGVAVILAAPYLLFAVVPAGLFGGAAVVAGLAALGPGGMLGGLAVVGAVAAGGGGVAATSLLVGNRKVVQQNVVFIQSMALAKLKLRPHPRSKDEWKTLMKMQEELATSIEAHKRLDDRFSASLKDLRNKVDDVKKALHALKRAGMGDEE